MIEKSRNKTSVQNWENFLRKSKEIHNFARYDFLNFFLFLSFFWYIFNSNLVDTKDCTFLVQNWTRKDICHSQLFNSDGKIFQIKFKVFLNSNLSVLFWTMLSRCGAQKFNHHFINSHLAIRLAFIFYTQTWADKMNQMLRASLSCACALARKINTTYTFIESVFILFYGCSTSCDFISVCVVFCLDFKSDGEREWQK